MNANTQQAAAPIDDKPEIKHEEAVDVLAQDEPAGRADYSGFITKTDPVEIRLVRKLDYRIMPCLVAMYFISFLDRNAITLAKLSSIEKDLRLTDVQYQTCVSIFFVGYCITSVPSNMILTRVRPSYFLCGSMLVWTAVSIATAFAHNFGGLMATRIVLGVVEAPFYPGALLIISNFYTRTEVATRIAILYTGGIMATAFAGLIAAGIYQLDGRLGLAGWQWLHIIIGICTGIITLICFPICPDTPLTTRWLSEDERALAHGRLQRDKVDQEAPGSTMAGLRQAVSDYRVWLFCACQFCHQGANGFKTFFPSVVGTLGFSTVTTLCLTCPPYIIAAIVTIVLSLSSGKFNERTWHITASKLVATFGFVLAAATLNTAARYVAMCIFTLGTYGVNSLILGWASTVCSQSQEKKAVTIAMMITCGNAAFIATPYLFIQTDRPRYTIAMSSMGAFSVATFLIAWAMKFILIRQNKTLARSGAPTKYPY